MKRDPVQTVSVRVESFIDLTKKLHLFRRVSSVNYDQSANTADLHVNTSD